MPRDVILRPGHVVGDVAGDDEMFPPGLQDAVEVAAASRR